MPSGRPPCRRRPSLRALRSAASYSALVVTSSCAMSDCSCASVAPYSAWSKPPNSTVAVVDGDLVCAQVAVGDLVIVQHPQRPPDPGHQCRLERLRRAGCRGRACARTTSIRGRAAVTASGEVLATPEIADGDGHQRAMLDDAAHRGLERRGFAAAQRELAPELAQRAATALIRAVQLELLPWSRRRSRPTAPAIRARSVERTVSAVTVHPASGHRPHGALEWHLERRGADDQHHQRADEPAHRQAQQ